MSEISDSVADVQGPEQPADRPRKPKLTRDERAAKNRANSLRSTGPRTPEGKAVSRCNAMTHRLTATTIPPDDAPGEPQGYYRKRLDLWIADVRPVGAVELALVEVACRASWRLDRVARFEAADANRRAGRRSDDPKAQSERCRARELGYYLMFTVGRDDYWEPVDFQTPNEYDDPPHFVDQLGRFPEGVEWLIAEWEAVLKDLAALPDGGAAPIRPCPGDPPRPSWEANRPRPPALEFAVRARGRAVRLLGIPLLEHGRPPRQPLIEAGQAELARLKGRLVELAGEAGSRRDADLALFDPGPPLGLLTRYQAAATRELFKAVELLAKLRQSPGRLNPGATEAGDAPAPEVEAPAPDVEAPGPAAAAEVEAPAAAPEVEAAPGTEAAAGPPRAASPGPARPAQGVRNEATSPDRMDTLSAPRDREEGSSEAERAGR